MKKQRTLLKDLKRRSGLRRRLLAGVVRERGGRENEGEVEGWGGRGESEGLLACAQWSRSNMYTGSLYRQPVLQIWRLERGGWVGRREYGGEQGREWQPIREGRVGREKRVLGGAGERMATHTPELERGGG